MKKTDMDISLLHNKLKLARREAKLTREEVCKEIGISTMTLYRYENNRSKPTLENLEKLAATYKVPLEYFVSKKK